MPTTNFAHGAGSGRANGTRPGSARQSTLRTSNLALVAQTVCASPIPISRAGVAAHTSMTRSTVSRLVDDLIAGGIVAELEPATIQGPGRPGTPLVAGRGVAALGLQVNAGYLAARVIDLGGRVVAEGIEPGDFVGSDPAVTLPRLERLAERVISRLPETESLVGAGLALPGIVSQGAGQLRMAPNLGWSDVYPARLLSPGALAGLPLWIGNEADLAAITVAEVAPGRPSGLSDFIYLSGEIGIGGAAVVEGKVMTGRHGWAGEIGHVTVDPSGPACPCGSTGCLERYAGKHAILAEAGLPTASTPKEFVDRARSGDARAVHAAAQAAWALGVALAGVINVLGIPAVVLGGHLGQIAALLRPDLEGQLQARVLSARWVPPTIVAAEGDSAPGATGAAMFELSKVLADPARLVD